MNYYWQEYAGRMPKEQVAIAKRMQNMRITLINDTTFEAVVDNEIVAKEFTGMIPTLQNYLRTRLKNRKVTMTVRISAPTEKVRAYGRVEKFQMMAQKNSALLQLKRRVWFGTVLIPSNRLHKVANKLSIKDKKNIYLIFYLFIYIYFCQ